MVAIAVVVVIAVVVTIVVVVTAKYTKPKDVSNSQFFPPPSFLEPFPEATRFGHSLCRDKQRGGTKHVLLNPEAASQSRACPSRICGAPNAP